MASIVYTTATGTATTAVIPVSAITFWASTLKKSHIEVRVSGAGDSLATFKTNLVAGITAKVFNTDYTIDNAGELTFVSTHLADGSVYQVELRRNSDIANPYVDFIDGSVVTEANLDDSHNQLRYLTEELTDNTATLRQDGSIVADVTGSSTSLATGQTIGMTGDVVWTSAAFDGSGAVTGTSTIQANSVTLGTDTTGDYVGTITGGTGITATGATSGEGITHTLSIDSAYVGQTSITTLGTVGTGTWEGVPVAIGFGGTGATSQQTAINLITNSAATVTEYVLTRNSSGDAVWDVSPTGPTGATGAQGPDGNFGGASFKYDFSTNTADSDPTAGRVKINNATQNTATVIYIDDADLDGSDIQSFMRTIDDSTSTIKGHVKISNLLDSSQFVIWTISSLIESSGYFAITVSPLDSSVTSPFSDGEDVLVTFARTGDKGDTGAVGTAATIAVGVVEDTTVAVGGDATAVVNNTGTSTTASFDFTFGIPTGATGIQGIQGIQGETGDPGADGDVVKDGTAAVNQVAVWKTDGSIEGDSNFVFDGTNVGIGTDGPADTTLEVEGDNPTIRVTANTDDWAALDIKTANLQSGYIFFRDTDAERARIQSSTADDLHFLTGGGTVSGMTIDSGGSVGIGRSPTTYELEVAGTAYALTTDNGGTGFYGVSGDAGATGTLFGVRGTIHNSVDAATIGYGVYGECQGDPTTGHGVYGEATGTGDTNYGGYFTSGGTVTANSYGLYADCASARDDSGSHIGIYAKSNVARTAAGSGGTATNYGGFFTAAGTGYSNIGGYFTASGATYNTAISIDAAAGDTAISSRGDVFLKNDGNTPMFVFDATNNSVGIGQSTAAAGYTLEVAGTAYVTCTDNAGVAVFGTSGTGATTGTLIGVRGRVASTVDETASHGYGVYGSCPGSPSTEGYGVYGSATGTGTPTNYGGYFTASGATNNVACYANNVANGGIGFRAEVGNASTTGTIYGVYSEIDSTVAAANVTTAYAVSGACDGNPTNQYGSHFQTAGTTVWADKSTTAYGVYGNVTKGPKTTAYGGYFTASDPDSAGTGGGATVTTTAYGVRGLATGNATTNYGGRFAASGATNNYGLVVDAGNVGILVASPTAALHVEQGGIYANGTQTDTVFSGSSSDDCNIVGSDGYWAIRTAVNESFNVDVVNGGAEKTALTILQDGNVGIGYAAPTSYKVQVDGTTYSALTGTVGGYAVYGRNKCTGSATHTGVYGECDGIATGGVTYAVKGEAKGVAANVYGGSFAATGAASSNSYGVAGSATGGSAGTNYGGYFTATGATTSVGIHATTSGTATNLKAGYFDCVGTTTENSFGVYIDSRATDAGDTHYGIYSTSRGVDASSDRKNIGGYFSASGGTDNYGLMIVDGTEGVGKVLTSDANGLATWESAGSGDMTGVDITAGDGLSITQSNTTSGDYTGNIAVDLGANSGLKIDTDKLEVDGGISQHKVPKFGAGVADNDFLRVDGTTIEGRSASEVLSDIGAAASGHTHSYATLTGDTNYTVCTVTGADAIQGEAKLTFDGSDLKVDTVPVKLAGLEDMWVPANAMRPSATAGCAVIDDVETSSSRPDMQVLDFDPDDKEHAQFSISMPQSWNKLTMTASFYWTASTTSTLDVQWGIQGLARSDNDLIDEEYGTAKTVVDDFHGTEEDLAISSATGAMTLAGEPAGGDLCFFQVFRDADSLSDRLPVDARLLGVKLHYTTNAANDA